MLVAFYHSEYTPTTMPSVAVYQRDVQKFVKLFPHVRQYQSWDEANRGNVPHLFSSPSAVAAAEYYQALLRVCKGCNVVGLDVLDQANISPTSSYVAEFKREIGRLRTIMPSIWGLHDYSDVNRWKAGARANSCVPSAARCGSPRRAGSCSSAGAFPNNHGSGLTRAAKVIKYTFALAGSVPQVKRLYIYDWTGGVNATRFDAGLDGRTATSRAPATSPSVANCTRRNAT